MTDVKKEMHELGNAIAAVQFCLWQLNGQQNTDELERLVRGGLDACEQGIAAFRKVHGAVSVPKTVDPSDSISEQARRHQMRAAEYRAVADQMQDRTARAAYRRLAESYEALQKRVRAT